MRTRWPASMASRWISSVAVPYSSAYSTSIVSAGSLPSLRTGTKPALSFIASGAAKMKPRLSMPTTRSTFVSPSWPAIWSMTAANAFGSRSRVVMS